MIKPAMFTAILSLLIGILYANQVYAHGRYILPSHTLLSGKEPQYVTLSASITNDIFHPDKPLGNNGGGKVNPFLTSIFQQLQATITLPDGSQSEDIHWHAYARQSISDIKLEKTGTYKVSFYQPPTPLTTFKNAAGEESRIFGNSTPLPQGATDITYHTVASRVETYISHNTPNKNAFNATGQGLELIPRTHPNDLFVGETAMFQLLLNGKQLPKNTQVTLTREGTRHRNQRETIKITTDQRGSFNINFKQSGFYLLEVEYTEPGRPGSDVKFHHHSLYLTLEIYPE